MRSSRRIFLLTLGGQVSLFAVFPIAALHAQSAGIQFDRISVEEGLSQDIVTSIVQDREGFMWFATEDGLNKYDGYTIQVFKHDPLNPRSLSSSTIKTLLVDSRGDLWIGGSMGIDRYDQTTELFDNAWSSPVPFSKLRMPVYALYEDFRSNLWIGAETGLFRLDSSRHSLEDVPLGLPDEKSGEKSHTIFAIFQDSSRNFFVGMAGSLLVQRPGADRFVPLSGVDTVRNAISAIIQDHRGRLWISEARGGLARISDVAGTLRVEAPTPSLGKAQSKLLSFAVCEDFAGKLWVGSFDCLNIFDPRDNSLTHFTHDPRNSRSLSSDRIYSIYRDRAGAMWLGTWHGGALRFSTDRSNFMLFQHHEGDPDGLSSDEILAILEDQTGAVWAGTDEAGLEMYDAAAKKFIHHRHKQSDTGSPSSNSILALLEDHNGDIWVGYADNTMLDRYDRVRNVWTHYPLHQIRSLLEDRSGNIWAGLVDEGLACLSRDRRTITRFPERYRDPNGLWGSTVYCLFEDSSGALWIGTWEGHTSLNRFDPVSKQFRHFVVNPNDSLSLSHNSVRSVCEGRDHMLWFGTWGGGVNRYDPTTGGFVHLTERDGLPSNYVKGILCDREGRLWISTEGGLTCYDPERHTMKNYSAQEGLQGYRFLSGSCAAGKSGRFYFGGEHGFNAFYPDSIRNNTDVPPIVITRIRVFDKLVQGDPATWRRDGLTLSYDQNFFSFEFVSLDYTQPLKNQYAYVLEGFDREWIAAGTRRYAAYTHLEPGTYVFRVKGSNNDGVWNTSGDSISVHVLPPFWRTWWFFLLCALIIVSGLSLLYRARIRKVIDVERLRTRLASDLHDELASNLTSIAMFSRMVRESGVEQHFPPEQRTFLLDRITTLSQESISSIRDIIWTIDPRRETLRDLLQRLHDSVVTECTAHGIVLRLDLQPEEALPSEDLQPEQRRHLWLILKEGIHNAIKHSRCSEITLKASYARPLLTIAICDNGRGIDPERLVPGKGFQTMRMRAASLGGSLTLGKGTGTGTEVSLQVRL